MQGRLAQVWEEIFREVTEKSSTIIEEWEMERHFTDPLRLIHARKHALVEGAID